MTNVATLGARTYAIRPAGVLGRHARHELLKAWLRCNEHEANEHPNDSQQRQYTHDLRAIARLGLVGAPDEVIERAPREQLVQVRSAYAAATSSDAQQIVAAVETAKMAVETAKAAVASAKAAVEEKGADTWA